jgi:hypothetical protein
MGASNGRQYRARVTGLLRTLSFPVISVPSLVRDFGSLWRALVGFFIVAKQAQKKRSSFGLASAASRGVSLKWFV